MPWNIVGTLHVLIHLILITILCEVGTIFISILHMNKCGPETLLFYIYISHK